MVVMPLLVVVGSMVVVMVMMISVSVSVSMSIVVVLVVMPLFVVVAVAAALAAAIVAAVPASLPRSASGLASGTDVATAAAFGAGVLIVIVVVVVVAPPPVPFGSCVGARHGWSLSVCVTGRLSQQRNVFFGFQLLLSFGYEMCHLSFRQGSATRLAQTLHARATKLTCTPATEQV